MATIVTVQKTIEEWLPTEPFSQNVSWYWCSANGVERPPSFDRVNSRCHLVLDFDECGGWIGVLIRTRLPLLNLCLDIPSDVGSRLVATSGSVWEGISRHSFGRSGPYQESDPNPSVHTTQKRFIPKYNQSLGCFTLTLEVSDAKENINPSKTKS